MEFGNILALAPMAAVTTPALRILIEDFGGCDLYFSEMINAGSLVQGGPYESYYTAPEPVPEKLVHQIVGGREDFVVEAGAILDGMPGFGVDFNMGCSAPEIVRAGAGVEWMKDVEKARRLVGRLRSRVRRKKLSVKLRLGFTEDEDRLLLFCRSLAEEGLDFLTLHPRLKKEKFGRYARWEYVDLLKREIRIPVLGNGDIRTFEDYMVKKTKYRSDGLMIGRGAAKAPWFFAYLRSKEAAPEKAFRVDLEAAALKFLEVLPGRQPADFLESRAKRFFSYFCGNLFFGHRLGSSIGIAAGFEEISVLVRAYFRDHPEERIMEDFPRRAIS